VPCTLPKRQAVVIFPKENYELSLVMDDEISKIPVDFGRIA
jgi:hypothetical protein